MPGAFDGFYVIENHLAYSKRRDCLRVIRDGITWSTLATDVPHAIELRADGEMFGASSVLGPDGNELRGPVGRLGTWTRTPAGLELKWPRWNELLVPETASTEPPLRRPRGRADDVLGLVIEQFDRSWRGACELDGATEVSLAPGDDLDVTFTRARYVVEALRGGALARAKLQFSTLVWDQYADYMSELAEPALPTPEALARELRVDTVAFDAQGIATLWFGRVLGEHSVLGVLSHDLTAVELSQP